MILPLSSHHIMVLVGEGAHRLYPLTNTVEILRRFKIEVLETCRYSREETGCKVIYTAALYLYARSVRRVYSVVT